MRIKAHEVRIGNNTSLGYVYLIEDNTFYVMDDEGVGYKNTWAGMVMVLIGNQNFLGLHLEPIL